MISPQSMRRYVLSALILCASQASCSFGEAVQKAEPCVARFHEQLDSERFREIHQQSSREFQASVSEPEMSEFLGAVHTKLGAVKSATQVGWHVRSGTGGTLATLTYETQFAGGPAMEMFTVAVDDVSCRLVNYDIKSRALIVK